MCRQVVPQGKADNDMITAGFDCGKSFGVCIKTAQYAGIKGKTELKCLRISFTEMRRHVFIKRVSGASGERFRKSKTVYVNRLGLPFVFAQYLS